MTDSKSPPAPSSNERCGIDDCVLEKGHLGRYHSTLASLVEGARACAVDLRRVGRPTAADGVEAIAKEALRLDKEHRAASEFIRACIEAVGYKGQPPEGFILDLDALRLQVIGEIERWKVQSPDETTADATWKCSHCGCANAATVTLNVTHCQQCEWSRKHTIAGVLHERTCGAHPCNCGAVKASCSQPSPSDTSKSAVEFIIGVAKDSRFSNEYLGNVVRSWLSVLCSSGDVLK